jgi:hypothetical protein
MRVPGLGQRRRVFSQNDRINALRNGRMNTRVNGRINARELPH